ncbi:VanZ family protein [Clostridium sp. OM07-9AC]|nr:VanZ family protein [Clostridium sp. OM07-9AC]
MGDAAAVSWNLGDYNAGSRVGSGNILLFLPFGILLPVCLPGRGHWLTVPAGILCSACIEYIQLRTGRGYCQLDDVVMNGLGALAGWLIWC